MAQVGITTICDPSYSNLRYPGADLPAQRGVCADVVVRAFRSIGIDLQVALHEDMQRNFRSYPQKWGLRGPDSNIDYRRVPESDAVFERRRKGKAINDPYEPGDVVAWRLSNGLYHIGVVSNVRGRSEFSRVHNISYGTRNDDVLRDYEIIGHHRW